MSALEELKEKKSEVDDKVVDDDDDDDDGGDDDNDNDDDDDEDHEDDGDDDDDDDDDEGQYEGKSKAEIKAMKARKFWKKKRLHRREKAREKKRLAVANGEDLPTKKRMVRWNGEAVEDVWARDFMLPNICIDGKFTAMLTDKERRSLRSQISHLYGFMRRTERPCHVWFASLEDSMRELIFHIDNASSWPIHFRTESVLELFPPDKHRIVYLSPDATEVLDDVVADTVYVVGGIVDRNRLKNATVDEAETLGLKAARLPIFETLQLRMNNSLNVNHVYEILQTQATTHNWRQTFEKCLPKRVFVKPENSSRRKKMREATEATKAAAAVNDDAVAVTSTTTTTTNATITASDTV
jgi:tRNA (guanine9-N1)-methyltransferase